MGSRSSSSTRSPSSTMAKRSERSRSESHLLETQARAGAQSEPRTSRDPGDKKHKSLDEVQQGGRPRQGHPSDRRANQSKK